MSVPFNGRMLGFTNRNHHHLPARQLHSLARVISFVSVSYFQMRRWSHHPCFCLTRFVFCCLWREDAPLHHPALRSSAVNCCLVSTPCPHQIMLSSHSTFFSVWIFMVPRPAETFHTSLPLVKHPSCPMLLDVASSCPCFNSWIRLNSSRKLSLILLDWSKWLCDEAFLQSSPLVMLLVLWLVKFIRSIVFLNVLFHPHRVAWIRSAAHICWKLLKEGANVWGAASVHGSSC